MYRLLIVIATFCTLLSCSKEDGAESKNRYYGDSYNFVVSADSMMLLRFLPSEASLYQDTVFVFEGDVVAVADILTSDSLEIQNDTAWVQLLKNDTTFGWVEEQEMIAQVVPDDPISQSISFFSDNHLVVFLIVIAVMLMAYFLRNQYRKGAPLVHFNDIDSAYPAVLALLVAVAASLYSSIQMFAADQWQNYFYHPTLNPLAESGLISWFLVAVWVIIIMAVACISEVTKRLRGVDALLYLCGLFAVCAANYIVYTVLTLYYIGYLLLLIYFYFAFLSRRKSKRH